MKQEYHRYMLKLIGNLILLLVLVTMFAIVWFYFYVPILKQLNRNFYFWGNWAVIGVYLLFLVFFTRNFDGYKIDVLRVKNLCFSNVLGVFGANIVGNLLVWIVSIQYINIMPMVILTMIQWGTIVIWGFSLRLIYLRMNQSIKILILYGQYLPQPFIERTNLLKEKFKVNRYFSVNEEEERLFKEVLEHDTVMLYDVPIQKRNTYLKFCYKHKKSVIITPKISDIIIGGAEELYFSDKPLLMIQPNKMKVDYLMIKRMMDIIGSTVAIVLTFPFMLLFSIAIKCYDGGKVFYTQERLTKDGKTFKIIKFRSMRENSEKGEAQLAKKNDSRVTPIGRILRITHLDELPQLFNILKGEMSLVGPRPERQEIAEQYAKLIPEFNYRLEVKAGLTGYAQVYGRYNTSPYDKLCLDLIYIENGSIGLDLKLILLTFKIIFQKSNTEGVEMSQKTAVDIKNMNVHNLIEEEDSK